MGASNTAQAAWKALYRTERAAGRAGSEGIANAAERLASSSKTGQLDLFGASAAQTRTASETTKVLENDMARRIDTSRATAQFERSGIAPSSPYTAPAPKITPTASRQPMLPGMDVKTTAKPTTEALGIENAALKTKAVNTETGGWKGALGAIGGSLNKHFLDQGGVGQMGRYMGMGAGGGIIGGLGAGLGSIVDPNAVQSNGIIAPMMQGAWKGAVLGAVHAGSSAMTKATLPSKWSNAQRYAKMTQNVAESRLTKGALIASGALGGGNISLTKPVNQVK